MNRGLIVGKRGKQPEQESLSNEAAKGCLTLMVVVVVAFVGLAGFVSLRDWYLTKDMTPAELNEYRQEKRARSAEREAEKREAERAEARRRAVTPDEDRLDMEIATKRLIRERFVDARDIEISISGDSRKRSTTYTAVASFVGVNAFGGPAPTGVVVNWTWDKGTRRWSYEMLD